MQSLNMGEASAMASNFAAARGGQPSNRGRWTWGGSRFHGMAAAALAAASATVVLASALAQAQSGKTASASTASDGQLPWVAAAPGRVEPKSGQLRIGTSLVGRIAEILVQVNNKVEEGELLIRLDDDEPRARLAGAEAEAAARRRERDGQPATAGREDVRRAEDAVFSAERAVTNARFELDYAIAARRSGNASEQSLNEVRRRLADTRDRLQRERLSFANAQSKFGVPAPNRLESSVSAARAEVAVAEALLDKTRVRAPRAGTVLQLLAKDGEMVAPSPEAPLVIVGDMTLLRVKAEVDEADVAKIKLGQRAFIRNNAYPGREFEGKVAELAPLLAPPRIGGRGPRRSTDVEVLEVTIDLQGATPLLPGMRADAFFRRD